MKYTQKIIKLSNYKLRPFPPINIPKRTSELITPKLHIIDHISVLAAFLAHPYLDLPKERALKQHEIDALFSFLLDNNVILRTINYFLFSKSSSLKKRRLVERLVKNNLAAAEAYEFAFVLKQEILKIIKTLTENRVEIILIKSFTEIPIDSNNFDLLIKKQSIEKARRILEKLGFTELEKFREHGWGGTAHKFLYRQVNKGIVLSIHLHVEVAWEGVKFVDENNIWENSREEEIDGIKLGHPSVESHILITVAHAFFENKCFALSDLIYMAESLRNGSNIDWDYIVDYTVKDGWFEPFYAVLYLANYIHESLFARKLVEKDILNELAQKGRLRREFSLEKKLIDLFDEQQTLPLRIPNNIVIMAFIKKVFTTPYFSFIEKSRKIFSTSVSYVKRRLKRDMSGSLVCFSGQDGTGKTQHSSLLQNELIQRNIMSDYVWSRGIGFSIEPFLCIGRLIIIGGKLSQSSGYVSRRRIFLRREPIRTLWMYTMLADEVLLLLLKVRIPLLLGRVVICDRYLLDIFSDIKCEIGKNISWVMKEAAKRLVPTPKIHFVLDAKPEIIMTRKKDLNPKMVICKRRHYLLYSRREGLPIIDTSTPLEKTGEEILTLFMKARYLGKN